MKALSTLQAIRKYGIWNFTWAVLKRTWHLTWHPYSQAPCHWQIKYLMDYCIKNSCQTNIRWTVDGVEHSVWVPARPLGYPSLGNRITAAYAVFSGKADVVYWPIQEDYSNEQRA